MQVDAQVFEWLTEFGLAKPKQQGAGGRAAAPLNSPRQLPARLVAGLISGESWAELLNSVFKRHRIRHQVAVHQGHRARTWQEVSKGLRKFDVELDDATLGTLADGDTGLLGELLGELHVVYKHWAATEAKKRRQRQPEQRPKAKAQAGQGGYSAAYRGYAGIPAGDAVSAPSTQRGDQQNENADEGASAPDTAREPQPESGVREGSRSPGSAREGGAAREGSRRQPSQRDRGEKGSQSPRAKGPSPRADARPATGEDTAAGRFDEQAEETAPPPVGRHVPAHGTPPGVDMAAGLSSLSPDRDVETATSAPELLALSMLRWLRVTPEQARALLAENAKRLARAFADGHERNCVHMARWLEGLAHYSGPLAELLLLEPRHTMPLLRALGHGLRAAAPTVAELTCTILAGICDRLVGHHAAHASAVAWLAEPQPLSDLVAILVKRPKIRRSAASLVSSCARGKMLPLFTQHLKQASRGEQDYLSIVHLLVQSYFEDHPAVVEELVAQGVLSHFLLRCVQRLGDDWSTPGTQQAAALLACDLWLAGQAGSKKSGSGGPIGQQAVSGLTAATPETLSDLLAALKKATLTQRSPTLQMVAFSCLARLLSTLCDRADPENTPAVYRTFVYALVEAESEGTRDFAMRNLMELLRRHEGVPVGILVEPMMKKFQDQTEGLLSVIDIELFSVISNHPRCTARHAEMLARVLGRASVESREFGRAAMVPLLAVLQRFAGEASIIGFFETFVQICLTRVIARGAPKEQCGQIHEVMAKVATLQVPQLEVIVRGLVGEISKAYLMSFECLHPNLQALLDLWPADDAEMQQWVKEQFSQPSPREEAVDAADTAGGLELRSITPSQQGDGPPNTLAADPHDVAGAVPVDADRSDDQQAPATEAEVEPMMSARTEPENLVDELKLQQIARETEALRNEMEEAKRQQRKAVEEAEALRSELDEARQLHSKVESEVAQLAKRREQLISQKGRSNADGGGLENQNLRRGRRRQQDKREPNIAAALSPEDIEKAMTLVQAFREPLGALFGAYARSKRSARFGRVEALPAENLEGVFAELGLVPDRLPKRATKDALRAARLKLEDEELLLEDFLAVLPHVASRAFVAAETQPLTDFGVPVPFAGDPDVRVQCQALMQYLDGLGETSKLASVRVTRQGFARARRQLVLDYAAATTADLNARLKKGEELKDAELPEGFEVQIRRPAPVYAVPISLPLPLSERHCAEILDDLLGSCLGIHFLGPVGDTKKMPQAVVKGYPDLHVLSVDRCFPRAPQIPQRPPGRPPAPKRSHDIAVDPSAHEDAAVRRSGEAASSPPVKPKAFQDIVRPRKEPLREARAFPELPQDSSDVVRGQRGPSTQRRPRQLSKERRDASEGRQLQRPKDETLSPVHPGVRQPEPSSARDRSADRGPKPSAPVGARDGNAERRPPPRPKPKPQPPRQDGGSSARREASRDPPAAAKREASRDASNAAPVPSAAPAKPVPTATPATAKALQKHHSAVEVGKARQEAFQKLLESKELQRLVKGYEPGSRRAFEFFSRWKGGTGASMQLPAFLLLGECFGLLSKDALKVVFRQAAGHEMVFEKFPEALLLCSMRTVEQELGDKQVSVPEERDLWRQTFQEQCRHMQLGKPKELHKCLDNFRRTGEPLPKFPVKDKGAAAGGDAAAAPAEEGRLAESAGEGSLGVDDRDEFADLDGDATMPLGSVSPAEQGAPEALPPESMPAVDGELRGSTDALRSSEAVGAVIDDAPLGDAPSGDAAAAAQMVPPAESVEAAGELGAGSPVEAGDADAALAAPPDALGASEDVATAEGETPTGSAAHEEAPPQDPAGAATEVVADVGAAGAPAEAVEQDVPQAATGGADTSEA